MNKSEEYVTKKEFEETIRDMQRILDKHLELIKAQSDVLDILVDRA